MVVKRFQKLTYRAVDGAKTRDQQQHRRGVVQLHHELRLPQNRTVRPGVRRAGTVNPPAARASDTLRRSRDVCVCPVPTA